MRLILRLLRWAVNVLFVCLLVALAVTLITPIWLDVQFRGVVSGSMEPAIPVGSVVVVEPVDPAALRYGDVVTYKSPESAGTVVTHRVLEVSGPLDARLFRTKGDANDEADLELVPAESVIGRVRFHLPYAGYLADLVRTRRGWLLMVVVPGAVLVIVELVQILRVIWASDGKSPQEADRAAGGSDPPVAS